MDLKNAHDPQIRRPIGEPLVERERPKSIYESLIETSVAVGDRPGISFQLDGSPRCRSTTMTWQQTVDDAIRFARFAREHGIQPGDKVAYLLPNLPETVVTYLGAMVVGCVVPINPLLEPKQIASILRTTGAKMLVTLAPIPAVDIAQRAAAAVAELESSIAVIEVDIARHLPAVKRWLAGALRPNVAYRSDVQRIAFSDALQGQPTDWTDEARSDDRPVACFHTGGTTGNPKVVQHFERGVIFTGWLGATMLFSNTSVALCPLPLFHVFGCHAVIMSAVMSGAHVVLPSPAGFRGKRVIDNFWRLIERWQATFVIAVPTAMSAMLQRPVDADVSSVDLLLCGSAPLPVALYERFERETGIEVVEGYGMTEATALVAANPIGGRKKIGSVGFPFPGVEVRIQKRIDDQWVTCPVNEIGEIAVRGPGVRTDALYLEAAAGSANSVDGFLLTGDLGHFDDDGYLWVTGRVKELIIRGGHNIDPAAIEAAFAAHPAVDLVAAVGQPDSHAGEVPCVYVTLRDELEGGAEALAAAVQPTITERAAWPKHVEIMDALPQTAVGKVFKPGLRKMAVQRVFDTTLANAGLHARTIDVVDGPSGLLVKLSGYSAGEVLDIQTALGDFTIPWR